MLQAERDQLSSELARLRVAAVGSEDKEIAWSKQVSLMSLMFLSFTAIEFVIEGQRFYMIGLGPF